jgi:HEPN domain-containing protein
MEEVSQWIDKAEHDFRTAEINLRENVYDASAFFSQQAAEKALKALYILRNKRLWKIHDLYEISKKLNAPKQISGLCEELTQHYIATRYPNEVKYSREDAEEALEQSREVIAWVKKSL